MTRGRKGSVSRPGLLAAGSLAIHLILLCGAVTCRVKKGEQSAVEPPRVVETGVVTQKSTVARNP